MTYTVRSCVGAAAFLAAAGPYLAREEAAHNILFGIAAVVRDDPGRYPGVPYFAIVEDATGAVVAAMLRTPPQNLILSRAPADALPAMAAAVWEAYDTLPGLVAPTEIAAAFAQEWQGWSRQPFRRRFAERVHELTAVIPPPCPVPGLCRRATGADRPLLLAWNAAFAVEAGIPSDPASNERGVDARLTAAPDAGGLWLWEDGGQPVSLAGYSGPTPHGIRVSPVYTPAAHRGRGYASANVAALSQWLLDGRRRSCFLFTDLANPTANKVYRQIGYRPVCDVDEYAFDPAP